MRSRRRGGVFVVCSQDEGARCLSLRYGLVTVGKVVIIRRGFRTSQDRGQILISADMCSVDSQRCGPSTHRLWKSSPLTVRARRLSLRGETTTGGQARDQHGEGWVRKFQQVRGDEQSGRCQGSADSRDLIGHQRKTQRAGFSSKKSSYPRHTGGCGTSATGGAVAGGVGESGKLRTVASRCGVSSHSVHAFDVWLTCVAPGMYTLFACGTRNGVKRARQSHSIQRSITRAPLISNASIG